MHLTSSKADKGKILPLLFLASLFYWEYSGASSEVILRHKRRQARGTRVQNIFPDHRLNGSLTNHQFFPISYKHLATGPHKEIWKQSVLPLESRYLQGINQLLQKIGHKVVDYRLWSQTDLRLISSPIIMELYIPVQVTQPLWTLVSTPAKGRHYHLSYQYLVLFCSSHTTRLHCLKALKINHNHMTCFGYWNMKRRVGITSHGEALITGTWLSAHPSPQSSDHEARGDKACLNTKADRTAATTHGERLPWRVTWTNNRHYGNEK